MPPTDHAQQLSACFFAREVETVARALIGATLLVDGVGGVIVETEAYDASDPASHCFRGRTTRNASMPTVGLDRMVERRGTAELRRLCAGPGRLCQALGVDIRFDGRSLDQPPFELWPSEQTVMVSAGPRIGISQAVETPWRFCLGGSRFLSRPMATAANP